jgi:hypothetical protein
VWIYRPAIDLVHTQRSSLKRRNGNGRRDEDIHAPKQLHEPIPELRAPMHRAYVVDAAIRAAARDHVVVLAIGTRQGRFVPSEHGGGLLRIGDRFDGLFQHLGIDPGMVWHQLGAKVVQRRHGAGERAPDLGGDGRETEIGCERDPESVQPPRRWIEAPASERQARGIARIVPGDHLEQERNVAHAATDRAGVRERSP